MVAYENDPSRQFCFDQLVPSKQDITTVGEALSGCNPQRLLDVLLDAEMQWPFGAGMLDDRYSASLERRVASVLEIMKLLTVNAESEVCDGENLLVPFEYFEAMDGLGCIRRRLGAASVNLDMSSALPYEFRNNFCHTFVVAKIRAIKEHLKTNSIHAMWHWNTLKQSLKQLNGMPWSEALSLPIWLPKTLCDFERYCVLGSVFWAMAYVNFGGSENRQHCDEASFEDEAWRESDNDAHKSTDEQMHSNFFCAHAAFYDEYFRAGADLADKVSDIVELLNYNCWVDFINTVAALVEFDKAA